MSDPYLITGPALISFSGGRTSAYMLHQILQAHGGALPADVVVAFANTGKEREETLRFVHECGSRWGVKVHWLEWRREFPGFEEMWFNSASRNGEPFKALIDWKKYLPNGAQRFCTEYLKVRAMHAFMKTEIGLEPGQYLEVIGLRNDEGMRILTGMEGAESTGRKIAYPMAKAKVAKTYVMKFWLGDNVDPKLLTHPLPQGFDLCLYPHEGNCNLCFQKGKGIRKRIIRDNPESPLWWNYLEVERGAQFDKRDSIADLVEEVRRSPSFFDAEDDMEHDVECGSHCGGDAA